MQHNFTPTPPGAWPVPDLVHLAPATCLVMTVVVLATLLAPVLAATLVLTWHGLRGTDPGPSAKLLLMLVKLVVPRRRSRSQYYRPRVRRRIK